MTRAYNTATTQQNSGGAVSPMTAGKNTVINGGFDIWQRGTSVSVAAASAPYTADRWQALAQTGQASTVSRQLTNDATNLPHIKYCARVQRNSGQTGTGDGLGIFNAFESLNSQQFAGRTVTFSFYARAGANFSASGNVLKARVYSGTGTDENVIVGYSGLGFPVDVSPVLTTTWQRFTYTAAIPTTVNEVQIGTYYVPTGTAGANDYFEVTGVQLEIGSVATPFSRAGGTIAGELAACQRYFQKSYDQSVTPGTANADSGSVVAYFASNVGNGSPFAWTKLHQTMRTVPTLTIYAYGGGTTRVSDNNNTDLAANSATVTRTGEGGFALYNNSGGTIAPGNNGFRFQWTGSAEL